MPSETSAARTTKARMIPLRRTIPRLLRNPLKALEEIGRESGDAVVKLDLGLFRPYLVTNPKHVQHILLDNADNYVREGMIWRPIRRLLGDGIVFDGPTWQHRRKLIRPVLSAKNVDALIDRMAEAIAEAVDDLVHPSRAQQPIDACAEMTRIVHRAVIRVFFADTISTQDADKLARATAAAFTSLGPRMLLPFVPNSVPLPGDGTFRRAVRAVDEIMYPIVREARRNAADGSDIVSLLLRARDENGNGLDDRQVRDDFVAMFIGGTDTTSMALTWLWVVLDSYPDVADRLYAEIDRVVGSEKPGRIHLADLRYTKMVLQELVRLYPPVWILPRTAKADDTIDGVDIKAGSTVVVSPYVTHRMESYWERPDVFDPERFSPDAAEPRQRFSYLSFGGGPHQCLGTHFFTVEGQLIAATLLSRYRPVLRGSSPPEPQAAVSLRPRRRVDVVLRPVEHS